MATEQKTEESTDKGTLDESQLKADDDILKDESSRIEDAGPLFTEEGTEDAEEIADQSTDAGSEKESGPEEKSAAAQPTDEKEQPAKEEAVKKEEKADSEKEEEGKPPPGYVPTAALKEARIQMRELKEDHQREIDNLRQELHSLKARIPQEESPDDARWKDFKVLSRDEFDELTEENPIDAIKYQQELREYERYQERKEAAEDEAQRLATEDRRAIQRSINRIEESVPGLYDEDSDIRKTLTDFAIENGLGKATIGIITDPGTLVLPPGAEEPVLLGDHAAELVEMVHKLYGLTKDGSSRGAIEKELRTQIEKEVRADLLKKFKDGSLGQDFKDISELPSGDPLVEDSRFEKTDFTEEEWAKLPESRRRALLGG